MYSVMSFKGSVIHGHGIYGVSPPQKKEEKRKAMEACENIRPAVGND